MAPDAKPVVSNLLKYRYRGGDGARTAGSRLRRGAGVWGGSHASRLAAGLMGERTAAMGAPLVAMVIAVAPSELRARESVRERAGSE